MSDALGKMLETRDWLLADGATATNLFDMGLGLNDSPELWNETHPGQVRELHRSMVAAGADIVLTNSFGANAARLKRHGAADRAQDLARIAAELGREVADSAGRHVVLAGSVGPTGEIMGPVGTLDHASAVEIFEQAAAGLKAGGADVLWLETIGGAEEFHAAAEAFARQDMPWCGSMSFDRSGRTMMGVTPEQLVRLVGDLANPPLAIGANCGAGASDLLRRVLGFSATGTESPIIAKASAGLPRETDGRLLYDASPALMAKFAVMARDAGARIVGGCCGVRPAHIAAMREALETQPRSARPTPEQVAATLGAFNAAPGDDDAAP